MKQFFKDLISGDSETSSKRFAALFTLLNVIILTYMGAWKSGWITPEFMYNSLVLLVGGGLGLTVVEKIFKKDPPPPTPPANTTTTTPDTSTTDTPADNS
jgi:hypothetical protein